MNAYRWLRPRRRCIIAFGIIAPTAPGGTTFWPGVSRSEMAEPQGASQHKRNTVQRQEKDWPLDRQPFVSTCRLHGVVEDEIRKTTVSDIGVYYFSAEKQHIIFDRFEKECSCWTKAGGKSASHRMRMLFLPVSSTHELRPVQSPAPTEP